MSYHGYRVGETNGVSDEVRQEILRRIFTGPVMPVIGKWYMSEWGEDKSLERLNKIESNLWGFILNKSHKDHLRALAEWEADLAWIQFKKIMATRDCLMDEFIFKVFMDQKEDELKTWSYDLVVAIDTIISLDYVEDIFSIKNISTGENFTFNGDIENLRSMRKDIAEEDALINYLHSKSG